MQTYSDTNTVTVLLPRRGWKPRKFISVTELKRPVKLQIGYDMSACTVLLQLRSDTESRRVIKPNATSIGTA